MTGFNSKRKATADKLQKPEREALKLALDALEESQTDNDTMEFWDRKGKAITAIKAALALPAQEPVAWNKPELETLKHSDNCRYWDEDIYCTCGAIEYAELQFWKNKALALPAQEPDALTIAYQSGFYDGKKAALAQPTQKPVAYVTEMSFGRFIVEPLNRAMVLPVGMALYSSPQGNK